MSDHQLEIDDALDSSAYSGTFRWKVTKTLPNMPPISRLSSLLEPFQISLKSGWRGYFFSRGQYSSFPGVVDDSEDAGDYLVDFALQNLCLVDCMSFPLSIAYILSHCGSFDGCKTLGKYNEINILCTGCAQRAEERILRQTNAFEELVFLLPGFSRVNLWLIGPEVSETAASFREFSYNNRKIITNLFQGNMGQFFRRHSNYLSGNTVVFGLNCGFGNFENPMPRKFDLLLSWISDLFFLTGTQLPLFFTCANHYADVSGEITVMHHILGANLILIPQENPFSFASTLIPPEEKWREKGSQPNEFSRGNAFFYGVQHCDKRRRKRLSLNLEDKSRILASMMPYLTQKIEVNDLMQTVVVPSLNFELVAESNNGPSLSKESHTNPSSSIKADSIIKADEESKVAVTLDSSLLSNSAKPHSQVSDIVDANIADKNTSKVTKEQTPSDISTSYVVPIAQNDFFATVGKLSSNSGPTSTRSGYSSKSSSPGTGLRNESKLLATIMAAKNASQTPSQTSSPPLSPIPSTTTSLCGDSAQTGSYANPTTAAPVDSPATVTSMLQQVPTKNDSVSRDFVNRNTKSEEVDKDQSLVQIEQQLIPDSKQLQILISSPLAPPHQLLVNTLALNLHTSGQRLRITTPTSSATKNTNLYFSREIMLFHKVKCNAKDLEAKYSKKKNLLTVKIALAADDDTFT